MRLRRKPERDKSGSSVAAGLPLSTLLSQVLVAFTIEFDNEFEHQSPHRTTRYGSTAGSRQDPWLGSTVMWLNCMQFVSDEGVTVREVERLARTTTNWNGMERWGTSSSNRIRPIAGQGRLAPTGQITIFCYSANGKTGPPDFERAGAPTSGWGFLPP